MTTTKADKTDWVDYHCHCLPSVDRDGCFDIDETAQMVSNLAQQGVSKIYATPHFYSHNESVSSFVTRRNAAYEKLCSHPMSSGFPEIVLSAEITIEWGLSECDLSPLLSDCGIALLELPYNNFKRWVIEIIENIAYTYSVIPVIAHIERYSWYEQAQLEELFSIDNIYFQVNCGVFASSQEMKWLKKFLKNDVSVVFGSDSHNMTDRAPDFDKLNGIIHDGNSLFKSKNRANSNNMLSKIAPAQYDLESKINQKMSYKK